MPMRDESARPLKLGDRVKTYGHDPEQEGTVIEVRSRQVLVLWHGTYRRQWIDWPPLLPPEKWFT